MVLGMLFEEFYEITSQNKFQKVKSISIFLFNLTNFKVA